LDLRKGGRERERETGGIRHVHRQRQKNQTHPRHHGWTCRHDFLILGARVRTDKEETEAEDMQKEEEDRQMYRRRRR
jgi:hypothetical protein